MDSFDNAIHYGPNDAGISTLTILLGIFSILIVSWLFGAGYGLVADFIRKSTSDKND
tara:strand:+ start:108 stop:278 length:171 start_codon:yes stop_codon:yes gene_type:complete